MFIIGMVQAGSSEVERKTRLEEARSAERKCHVDEVQNEQIAFDDISGGSLDVTLVKAARQEEADYIRRMKLYTKVPISDVREANR